MLDLESEVMRGLDSIPTEGNIFHWIFCFHVVKLLIPILALLPFLCIFEKTLMPALVESLLFSCKRLCNMASAYKCNS